MCGRGELPVLSVTPTPDGLWCVNERGARVALAYFPSKWGALKHAVKAARAKPARTRVALLDARGGLRASRDYEGVSAAPEVP
jgi:hypothetical protein